MFSPLSCPSYSHGDSFWLITANQFQRPFNHKQPSQTMTFWESCTSAQCLSNLNTAHWNNIQILFSTSSIPSHLCCFCDARNDVCFRLQVFKWVDVFELEADSWWAQGFVLLKGTWWGALILLPFSQCCLSSLTGGCRLSLPEPNFFSLASSTPSSLLEPLLSLHCETHAGFNIWETARFECSSSVPSDPHSCVLWSEAKRKNRCKQNHLCFFFLY